MKLCRYALMSAALLAAACDQKPKMSLDEGNSTSDAGRPASSDAIAAELSRGNFGQAAEMARAATHAQPNDPQIFLLLARAEARLNNLGYAVDALGKAFEVGFHDPRGAANHPDFDKIRGTSEFQALLKKWGVGSGPSTQPRLGQGGARSETRAGDVSISEGPGGTRIQAGDVIIED